MTVARALAPLVLAVGLACALASCSDGEYPTEPSGDCVPTDTGSFTACFDALPIGEGFVRTPAEHDEVFACEASPPPLPPAGMMLAWTARGLSGCINCFEVTCVRDVDDGTVVETASREHGGCGAPEENLGAWALLPDDPAVRFENTHVFDPDVQPCP